MVWAAALVFFAAGEPDGTNEKPWERDPIVAPAISSWSANDGSIFAINAKNTVQDGSGVYVWITSDHRRDPKVPYRTLMQRIRFGCNGTQKVVAVSTYDAAGRNTYTWDGIGSSTAIRPGTMLSWAESLVCKK